jgi:hypothetical protein
VPFDRQGNLLFVYQPNNLGRYRRVRNPVKFNRSASFPSREFRSAVGAFEQRIFMVDYSRYRIRVLSYPQGKPIGWVGAGGEKSSCAAVFPALQP